MELKNWMELKTELYHVSMSMCTACQGYLFFFVFLGVVIIIWPTIGNLFYFAVIMVVRGCFYSLSLVAFVLLLSMFSAIVFIVRP